MTERLTYVDAFANWESEIKPSVIEQYGADDAPALSESWFDYTDMLCKDGRFSGLQYHYCPAYDETMPDDHDHILESMGVICSAVRVTDRPDGLMSDIPGANHYRVLVKRHNIEFMLYFSKGSALTGEPKLSEVMYSLLSDAYDVEGNGFEEWADNYGFDTDSRRAERMFKACQKTLLNLKTLFSPAELNDLHELFSDY